MIYLFTDRKGKLIEIVENPDWIGIHAKAYRDILTRKYKKQIVSWAHMGSRNTLPLIK